MNLYSDISRLFCSRGYNAVIGDYFTQVDKWISWYRGSVNDFHFYNVNGLDNKLINVEKKTLNMAKKACEDFAKLEYGEESCINIKNNDVANEYLKLVLEENDFNNNFVKLLETSKAFGNSYITEYVENDKIKLDFINSKKAIITSYDNRRILGLVTITQKEISVKKNEKVITHLQHHIFEDGIFKIEHFVFESDNKNSLGKPSSLQKYIGVLFTEEFIRNLKQNEKTKIMYSEIESGYPLFQRFCPNIVNNFDIDSQYGISRFANSIDTLKAIDNKYDGYDIEFINSRNRLFVDASLTKEYSELCENSGVYRQYKKFDGDTSVFVSMPNMAGDNDNRDKIVVFNPTIREVEFSQALNNELALFGFKFGLGKNQYEFKNGIVMTTATAVKVGSNEKWMSIEADRKITGQALKDLARVICILGNELGHISCDIDNLEIEVFFDDSVAIDKQAELDNSLKLVNSGIMSKRRLLTETLGYTYEEADTILNEVNTEQNAESRSIFGVENDTAETQNDMD